VEYKTVIRISWELAEAIKDMAAAENRSMNSQIKTILEDVVAMWQAEKSPAPERKRG